MPGRVIASTDRIRSSSVASIRRRSRTICANRLSCRDRLLRDLGGLLVSKIRTERRRERGTALEQLASARFVSGDAIHRAHCERTHRVAQNRGRMQRVPRDDRHHHIQLELSGLRSHADGRVAADDLKADLVDHLGHRRVHLARHDRRPGLHGGQRDFGKTGAWPHAQKPQVARNLPELDRQSPHRTGVRQHVAHALRHAKAIRRRNEVDVDARAEVLDRAAAELIAGIESGAHRGRTKVHLFQLLRRARHIVGAALDAGGVAAELLSERHRHGILKMRAADFEDGCELTGLLVQGRRQCPRCVYKGGVSEQQGDTRGRREHVVGGLSHVDVIVGVHQAVLAFGSAEQLAGPVGEHLVDVHVV